MVNWTILIAYNLPFYKNITKSEIVDHVLNDFDEEEIKKLEKITDSITSSLPILLDKKLDLFSSTVNNQ